MEIGLDFPSISILHINHNKFSESLSPLHKTWTKGHKQHQIRLQQAERGPIRCCLRIDSHGRFCQGYIGRTC